MLVTNLLSSGIRTADAPSPWSPWELEDRLANADVVALGRWDEPSGAAIYENPGARVVYIRRKLHVSRVFVGSLPRHTNMLVRGGACFDRNMKRYVLDDEEAVYLPRNTGQFIVLLKHLRGSDYELVDGLRGFLSGPIDTPGQATTFITTHRRDLLPPGSIVPARTPSPEIAAARVSFDQLGEILDRLAKTRGPNRGSADAPRPYRVRNADAVDRKTIVEDFGATADRLIAAKTGDSFFRQHLIREVNPQWIPAPIGGRHVHQPSEEWRGIGFAYRLRAFGRTSETEAVSIVVGPDRSNLGAERVPDCAVNAGACEFKVDELAAERIARDDGLEEGSFPWKANLHWEPSCRAFVWSIMNAVSSRESQVLLVTAGSGKICGKQYIASVSSGVPRPDLEPPPPKVAPSRPPPGGH